MDVHALWYMTKQHMKQQRPVSRERRQLTVCIRVYRRYSDLLYKSKAALPGGSSLRTGLMGLTPRIPKATDSSLTSVLSVGILSNLLSDSFLCQSAVFRHNIVSYIVSFILSRSYACGSRSHKRIKDNVSDI